MARLGISEFFLWDHDHIEGHNISSQSFSLSQNGLSKVYAMADIIYDINNEVVPWAFPSKFSGKEFVEGVLVIAVDSMKERRKICNEMMRKKMTPDLIIDGRMGGNQLEVYTCKTLEEWEKTFVDKPGRDSCGARYICYISMVIGAFIANQIKRHLKNEPYKKSILFNIDSLQILASK